MGSDTKVPGAFAVQPLEAQPIDHHLFTRPDLELARKDSRGYSQERHFIRSWGAITQSAASAIAQYTIMSKES